MEIINCDNLSRPSTEMHYKKVRSYLYGTENNNVSVIVQAYGRLDKTKNCVESILKYTNPGYDLILMDNGTPDMEIADYFESVEYPKKRVIRFSKNITGVYAVNATMHLLKTKYIVLVNNDVIVTSRWLENLLICAESDESIGMIVPASTNISNLQFESLGGFESIEEMQDKADKFNVSDPGKWEEKIRLIPTATLYRREVFDAVGMYDVGFMHDFGDDEFTFRVRRAGYKLMLCKDTFVHHDHNQTALPPERMAISQQSREFFREKYDGIDAWADTGNYMGFAFENVRFEDEKAKNILVLDVKCGTPLLEAKNFLRKNNLKSGTCKAYTSDTRYYIDLRSISDCVVCGDIENTIINEENKYDIIILGEAVNLYNAPFKLLKKLVRLKKENGYLIFPVSNTNDIRSLFSILNISLGENDTYPRRMNYNDILNKIADFGIEHADVTYTMHNIEDMLKTQIASLVLSMDVKGDKNAIMQNLLIENYWITAK
ncbi:glycosyltransferase family 2 protein [Porcipelethomonas sp.]|uniref:glycosyltransferase family 2 protein n=1 Tax=Porcipelethomonas sp. TaxID=2981675 RepID=UPI003EF24692